MNEFNVDARQNDSDCKEIEENQIIPIMVKI